MRTGVGAVHGALVAAQVVPHAVLPLESLLTHRALERPLVRMGQTVPPQVINVTESFAASFACVALPFAGASGAASGRAVRQRPHEDGRSGSRAAVREQGDGGGARALRQRPHEGRRPGAVRGLMAPQVVTVLELFGALSAYVGPFAFRLPGRRGRFRRLRKGDFRWWNGCFRWGRGGF